MQKDFPARNAWSRANQDFFPINKGDGTETCIIEDLHAEKRLIIASSSNRNI